MTEDLKRPETKLKREDSIFHTGGDMPPVSDAKNNQIPVREMGAHSVNVFTEKKSDSVTLFSEESFSHMGKNGEDRLRKAEDKSPRFVTEENGGKAEHMPQRKADFLTEDQKKALSHDRLDKKVNPLKTAVKGMTRYEAREADEMSKDISSDKTILHDMLDQELGRETRSIFRKPRKGLSTLSREEERVIDDKARKILEERRGRRDERFRGKEKGPGDVQKDTRFRMEKFHTEKTTRFSNNSLARLRGRPEKREEKEFEAVKKKLVKKNSRAVRMTAKKARDKRRVLRIIKAGVKSKPLITGILLGGFLLLLPLILVMFIEAAANTMFSTIAAYKAHSIFEDMQNLRRTADSASDVEKIIYREMLSYFDGNRYAAAAVVGNIYCETGSRPDNLQNIFNPYLDRDGNFNFENNGGSTSRRLGWGEGVSDEDYTLGVTYGAYVGKRYMGGVVTIDGHTFPLNSTRNRFACDSAGYGLCQWTYCTRKAALYDFAQEYARENDEYFTGYADISDARMQVKYLQHELDTLPEYRPVTGLMKAASSVEEASDIWMLRFECPYDQSERAREYRREKSREKLQALRFVRQDVGDLEEVDGSYFNQTSNGPCFACSMANLMKRYCYLSGDGDWADIVPYCTFDNGMSIYSSIVFSGTVSASWTAKDSSGNAVSERRSGWGVGIRGSYSLHGISFSVNTGYNITKSGLIDMLDSHPEGVVIYQSGHAKLITRYDSSYDDFYCVDPVAGYSHGYERLLRETWGWDYISGNNQYEYIPTLMKHKSD